MLPGRIEDDGKWAVPLDFTLCCHLYSISTIMPLLRKDQEDREFKLEGKQDWGGEEADGET